MGFRALTKLARPKTAREWAIAMALPMLMPIVMAGIGMIIDASVWGRTWATHATCGLVTGLCLAPLLAVEMAWPLDRQKPSSLNKYKVSMLHPQFGNSLLAISFR